MIKSIYRIIFFLIIIQLVAWIDPFKDSVNQGNDYYAEKKYDKAIDLYKKSEKYLPNDNKKYDLAFNKGDAEFKKGNFDAAIDNFKYSLNSPDRGIQKKAFFNMGNASVKMGKYKDAMESYVNALKIDPNYAAAKKNIEYLLNNKKNKSDKKNDQNKDGKGKNKKNDSSKKDGDKGKKNSDDQKKSGSNKKMSKEQIKNILKSMKNKPVRRQKGRSDGRRSLEKYW